MNREQAEHILDAYVALKVNHNDKTESINALHDVILDAMTEYRPSTITVPNITYPQITTTYGKPIVTCGVGE